MAPDRPLLTIATLCFAASGPAAATDVSVTAATTTTSTNCGAFMSFSSLEGHPPGPLGSSCGKIGTNVMEIALAFACRAPTRYASATSSTLQSTSSPASTSAARSERASSVVTVWTYVYAGTKSPAVPTSPRIRLAFVARRTSRAGAGSCFRTREYVTVSGHAPYQSSNFAGTYARTRRSRHELDGSHDSGSVTRAISRWRTVASARVASGYACSLLYGGSWCHTTRTSRPPLRTSM